MLGKAITSRLVNKLRESSIHDFHSHVPLNDLRGRYLVQRSTMCSSLQWLRELEVGILNDPHIDASDGGVRLCRRHQAGGGGTCNTTVSMLAPIPPTFDRQHLAHANSTTPIKNSLNLLNTP
ncbi:hypothetical protein E2C01_011333 [Portunus trituberculatus]|uniref:Uncharacterized protein n=1 Tax=Portunus trituberculatus TaxID=210409 RepID=A0A5B7DB51_PORTR|nr:hypothetical protein [Portunus trituberculatus]